MSKNKIMPWVDALPNVEATDFQARRDQIEATMAELVKQAEELRGKAYFAALSLEASAKGEWSSQAVEQAKRSVGW
ncbi:stable inheritance protein KleA [Variovorax paradoxus]|uniref:stable inheritance protein KleA n=1 Tax=Variovorax paradoxus TaxID=34073 RepID=UPI001F1FB0B6|nr:stable inheritance protein KleA [Variovorax paradoxus]UKI12072.1 stable inheritance protein KleA [Variovorax paradoxus]